MSIKRESHAFAKKLGKSIAAKDPDKGRRLLARDAFISLSDSVDREFDKVVEFLEGIDSSWNVQRFNLLYTSPGNGKDTFAYIKIDGKILFKLAVSTWIDDDSFIIYHKLAFGQLPVSNDHSLFSEFVDPCYFKTCVPFKKIEKYKYEGWHCRAGTVYIDPKFRIKELTFKYILQFLKYQGVKSIAEMAKECIDAK